MPPRRSLLVFAVVALAGACGEDDPGVPAALTSPGVDEVTGTPVRTVEVVTAVPHGGLGWTQGLVFHDGRLYESTGLAGGSRLGVIDPTTGELTRSVPVDPDLYAEGLALVDDRLIQLTWKDGVALVRDRDTLDELDRHRYDGEGWGLCYDGRRLVMSDGSADLTFRDPTTFEATGSVTVRLDGEPVGQLNELECVEDRVLANVWHTDTIVEVDPDSGRVTSVIDAAALAGLLEPPASSPEAVLNGIAHDPEAGTYWLTGKLWPQLFEVRLVDPEAS